MPDKAHPATPADADDVVRTAQRFLAILYAHLDGGRTGLDGVLKAISTWREFMAAFPTMKPASKAARAVQSRLMELLEAPPGACVLLGWLLLRHAGADSLETFGLDCTLRRVLKDPGASRCADRLLRALLAWGTPDGGGQIIAMARAFSCPACRDFMLIHESDGVEWFNKERFEELAEWLAVIDLVALALKRPTSRAVSAWLGAAGREQEAVIALAAHAGYRSNLFQQLLEPTLKIGAGTPVQQNKGKDSDAQGGARAHTSKTPDDTLPR